MATEAIIPNPIMAGRTAIMAGRTAIMAGMTATAGMETTTGAEGTKSRVTGTRGAATIDLAAIIIPGAITNPVAIKNMAGITGVDIIEGDITGVAIRVEEGAEAIDNLEQSPTSVTFKA